MAISGVTEFANRIPELWANKMYAQLRNDLMFANVFMRDYEGEMKFGDTINVQQIQAPTGEVLTDDEAAFATETLTIVNKQVVVNKRASASFDISDLAKLQSLSFEQEVQDALVYAVSKQLETQILAALIPSAAAPDHQIAPASASDLAAVDLAEMKRLLDIALVPASQRTLFLDANYYADLLTKTQIMSRDFTSNSSEAGVADNFLGFRIVQHNMLTADVGYAVHPSCLALVMQQGLRIKVSDLHATGYYGYKISADLVFGMSLFDNKRLVKISG